VFGLKTSLPGKSLTVKVPATKPNKHKPQGVKKGVGLWNNPGCPRME